MMVVGYSWLIIISGIEISYDAEHPVSVVKEGLSKLTACSVLQ
jgi:hypothetical protein